jgi:hypothetical protein
MLEIKDHKYTTLAILIGIGLAVSMIVTFVLLSFYIFVKIYIVKTLGYDTKNFVIIFFVIVISILFLASLMRNKLIEKYRSANYIKIDVFSPAVATIISFGTFAAAVIFLYIMLNISPAINSTFGERSLKRGEIFLFTGVLFMVHILVVSTILQLRFTPDTKVN